jgi:HEAT repeat protein
MPRCALVLALALLTAACGGEEAPAEGAGTTKSYVKKTSQKLKDEGALGSAEEKVELEAERERKRDEFEKAKKTSKLESQLAKAEDDFDRAEIVAKIAQLGAAGAPLLPKLEELLASEDAELRIQVYRAVGAVAGKDGSRLLRKSFEDDEDAVKAAGLDAWRKAGLADMSPALRFLDGFEDPAVQRAALRTLLSSVDLDRHLPTIVEKMPDLNGAAVKPGLEALGKREKRVPGYENLIVALADHQDAAVRVMAIREMGRLNEKKRAFAAVLVRCLGDDPNLQVRVEAYKLMGAWAGSDDPPPYKADADAEARQASGEAWKSWLEKNAAKFSN